MLLHVLLSIFMWGNCLILCVFCLFYMFVVLILLLFVDYIAYWMEYVIIALLQLCFSIESSMCLLCFLRCEVREFSYGALRRPREPSPKINQNQSKNWSKLTKKIYHNYSKIGVWSNYFACFVFSSLFHPFGRPSGTKLGAKLGPSWAKLGQVGCKMRQVASSWDQVGAKLGPSWRRIVTNMGF